MICFPNGSVVTNVEIPDMCCLYTYYSVYIILLVLCMVLGGMGCVLQKLRRLCSVGPMQLETT